MHAHTQINIPASQWGQAVERGKRDWGPRRPPTERPRFYPLVPFLGVKTLLPDMSMETHAGFPEATRLFLGSGGPFPQSHILLRHHDADRTIHGGLKGPCMGDLGKIQHRSALGWGWELPQHRLRLSPRRSWDPEE